MINTLWESAAWQSDMQLIGKVALSATAVFLLALAYRFYKLRQLESTGPNGKHDPGCGTDKSPTTVETPQQDYNGDKTGNLRFRCVHNNRQNSTVTDRGIRNLQEGLLPDDVTCKDQSGRKGEDAERQLSKDDPLQSLPQFRDNGDDQTDECKKSVSKAQDQDCRQDPEGGEMQGKSVLADGSTGPDSKDLPPSHQNQAELHQVISTPTQDNVTADGGPTPGTIMESSSQSATDEVDLTIGVHEPILQDLLSSTEKGAIDIMAQWETTNNEEEKSQSQEQNVFKDHLEKEANDTKTQGIQPDLITSVQASSSFSNQQEQDKAAQPGPNSYRIDFHEDGAAQPGPNSYRTAFHEDGAVQPGPNSYRTAFHEDGAAQPGPNSYRIAFQEDGAAQPGPNSYRTAFHEDGAAQPGPNSYRTAFHEDGATQPGPKSNRIAFHEDGAAQPGPNYYPIAFHEDGATQPGPNSYRIAFHEDTFVDIHLNLENCYEVLCMAKKNNHDALLAAAYKTMTDDYLQILQNPAIYGRLNATERDFILEGRMKGKRFVVVADIDTQANNAPENKSSLSYYDSHHDQWHALSHIPSEAVSRGCSMATLFNYIFIVLGSDGLDRQMKPSRRVLCYNPLTNSWKEVAPLKEARPHCKLVALDGCLYAIGGECLHTVEKYDPRLNRWSYVAPLPNDTFAVAHMATAYDEEIYVTGGTIRYMLLRYNLREKLWKNSHISGSKDRTTEIIATGNFLYRFDLNRNMGISVHRCNVRARIWYECATYAMPYPSPFQCVVIDNSIFCISRNFHLRFLADEVSPRFLEVELQTVPAPKGLLYPLVLVLPVKGVQ